MSLPVSKLQKGKETAKGKARKDKGQARPMPKKEKIGPSSVEPGGGLVVGPLACLKD